MKTYIYVEATLPAVSKSFAKCLRENPVGFEHCLVAAHDDSSAYSIGFAAQADFRRKHNLLFVNSYVTEVQGGAVATVCTRHRRLIRVL